MSEKKFPGKTALAAFAIVAGFGSAYLMQHVLFTEDNGASYLKDKGYKNVSGGHIKYFNFCGRGATARRYDAEKDGVREKDVVVCYRLFQGAYTPTF